MVSSTVSDHPPQLKQPLQRITKRGGVRLSRSQPFKYGLRSQCQRVNIHAPPTHYAEISRPHALKRGLRGQRQHAANILSTSQHSASMHTPPYLAPPSEVCGDRDGLQPTLPSLPNKGVIFNHPPYPLPSEGYVDRDNL